MLKIGDQVVMNDKYYVPRIYKNVIFEVKTEPRIVCGTVVVNIESLDENTYRHAYATDGLDKVCD